MPVSNEWLGFLGLLKLVVVWQTSQEIPDTGTWLDITPLAVEPLWQVEQVPGATPVWLNLAPVNVVVDLWQVSQEAVVGM